MVRFLLHRFAISAKSEKHTCTRGRDSVADSNINSGSQFYFRVNWLALRAAHCRNLEGYVNEQIELIS